MTAYLHGIEVIEVSDPPAVTSVNSSVIGLVGTLKTSQTTSSTTADSGKEPEKLYLIKSIKDFDTQFEGKADSTGTLYHAVRDVFSQSAAEIVISVSNGTNKTEAINLLLNAPSQVNVTPKILIVPGLDTTLDEVEKTANTLKVVAEKLKSIALVDLIKPTTATTDTDFLTAITSAKIEKSDRLYLIYPGILVNRKGTDGKEINMPRPASSFVAGLIVKSDTERGFWYSPSNYPFSNIAGVTTQVPFFFGEKDCLANQLNKANINTIIWYDKYRLWGNKSYTTQSQYKFLSIRRITDILNRSLMDAHFWAIDQNITKNLKDTILDSVNHYMRKLKMQGAIINGTCWVDPEKNTEESLSAGELYFCFDFTPPYPAERITFTSIITNNYIKEVLS